MKTHVRAELSKLRDRGDKLDYAYVSHIDQDLISGILQLLEDELEWRLFHVPIMCHVENRNTRHLIVRIGYNAMMGNGFPLQVIVTRGKALQCMKKPARSGLIR